MNFVSRISRVLGILLCPVLLLAACTTARTDKSDPVSAVSRLVDGARDLRSYTLGTDRFGVWICHIPLDTRDPLYNPVDFRLPLDAHDIAAVLNEHVTAYFDQLSHGQYRPTFSPGGDVSLTAAETNQDCVRKAQRRSVESVTGLIVIADAEHAETAHGGWGRPGTGCQGASPCLASRSGRAAYIGASDFHPDWGRVPALDLLEHEIGHTLGFPHSGGGDGYRSAIDVMSNSAAPRDHDPEERDGPDTIAVNRLAAGWLGLDDVGIADGSGTWDLAASQSPSGRRLLVLPLDGFRFLSVEVLDNTGLDSHLPHAGVVVHEIDQSPAGCAPQGSSRPCLNEYRSQVPLSGTAPFAELLKVGDRWSGEGWAVRVMARNNDRWSVGVERTS